jgi:hypothetical protein
MEVCLEYDEHFRQRRLTTLTGHVFAGATLPFGNTNPTQGLHVCI